KRLPEYGTSTKRRRPGENFTRAGLGTGHCGPAKDWRVSIQISLSETHPCERLSLMSEKPKSVKVTVETYGDVLAVEKTFKTGSRGDYGSEKIEIAGKRYQVGINIVEIGSKPKIKATATDS